jgi:hypothetical protein
MQRFVEKLAPWVVVLTAIPVIVAAVKQFSTPVQR